MTQDEIIRMAREAGIEADENNGYLEWWNFAKLVAAHEREACAKVCETEIEEGEAPWTACDYAAAIRARGNHAS